MALITVGTGIGGGLVIGGELIAGRPRDGGRDGPRPGGAGRAARAAVAGTAAWSSTPAATALVRYARERAAGRPGQRRPPARTGRRRGRGDQRSAGHPGRAARATRPRVAAFAEIGRWLGSGLADLVQLLDPEMLVVGGGVIEAGELLLAPDPGRVRRPAARPAGSLPVAADRGGRAWATRPAWWGPPTWPGADGCAAPGADRSSRVVGCDVRGPPRSATWSAALAGADPAARAPTWSWCRTAPRRLRWRTRGGRPGRPVRARATRAAGRRRVGNLVLVEPAGRGARDVVGAVPAGARAPDAGRGAGPVPVAGRRRSWWPAPQLAAAGRRAPERSAGRHPGPRTVRSGRTGGPGRATSDRHGAGGRTGSAPRAVGPDAGRRERRTERDHRRAIFAGPGLDRARLPGDRRWPAAAQPFDHGRPGLAASGRSWYQWSAVRDSH